MGRKGSTVTSHILITNRLADGVDEVLECKERNVGGIQYKARSRGNSSPNSLAFVCLRNAQTIGATTQLQFSLQCEHQVRVLRVEWSGTRPMGEQW